MKTKFLLPVLAMIFAIGMSFTTVNTSSDPNMDYIVTETEVIPVEELDCGSGTIDCEARLTPGGTPYPVFHDQALKFRKKGNGQVKNVY